ncbi:polygalacturonase-like [Senna tora]|uniref:Polygalacturonase-like n=1 Tax=Senna tora TaxID=362788 RepID=A0A834SQ53_9FABA|nr:polygalacturonase-like [Senna tora]
MIFDIIKYGASPNRDMTQALKNAWKDACASTNAAKILIATGTYKLGQVDLRGPCKAPIEVQVDGIILAPADLDKHDGNTQWVKFGYINFFTLSGGGTFDGQGQSTWKQNDCGRNKICKKLSMINIIDSFISTSGDCISLGDGSRKINVLRVTCGSRHRISVGSLGKFTYEEPVEGFTVKNCTFRNTDNGVRLKTWPGAPGTTTVSDLHYEDIIMVNMSNPILIEQEYCPYNQCPKETPSKIKISKVTFENIKATSATPDGVKLICSSGVPCEDAKLSGIDLTFNGAPTTAKCAHVKPVIIGKAPSCVV